MNGCYPICGEQSIALKIDVCTCKGTLEGVPRLLDLLRRYGIKATFYFSMGPDNSGKVLRRIFRKGFLRKLLSGSRASIYSGRTLLYGTILPPPLIAEKASGIMQGVKQAGHEIGLHCWDHLKWHDYLPWLPKQAALMELGRASAAFETVFGHRSRTTAAPGWTASADSLEIQDAMGLDFCSDARGTAPFFPIMEGRRFKTLQIPTTWPTLDELLGDNGVSVSNINGFLLSRMRPGLNVHTVHPELEGGAYEAVFSDLLENLLGKNVRFVTLADVAKGYRHDAPYCEMSMGCLQGSVMPVAIQGGAEIV